ncbi:MAG: nucleotidyltransferase family protein [Caldilineaceae bacterium]|nr:nucleotidyltransferase family protein [Caldilineaceae bacterium]MCB9150831.1 nucleotidyltransferase family protein [Caldilineaceae bacterium]
MERAETLQRLSAHREELHQQFGVTSLVLFGSTARDTVSAASDVDLLVEFDRPTGLFGLLRLQFYLEELLGCSVDVGTFEGLKPRIRDRVMAESIHVN